MPASERGAVADARSTPRDVRAALARTREAGAPLRRMPRRERVAALGRVLERFRAPSSPERLELERLLPEATGFAPETVREGLARALAPFSAAALAALAERELGGLGPGRVAHGFEATAVLLGGGVPTPALLALAAPLVLGSPVVARSSSHDPVTARLFAAALAAESPALAAGLALVSFPHDDEAALRELLAAPCVVAFGSDETMAALAAGLGPAQRFVRHGHRLSLAVLGPEAQSGAALERAAEALALDVALWDQRGCLSPLALHVLGVESVPDAVARALVAAFEGAARRWPRGRAAASERVRLAQERETLALRVAASPVGRADAAAGPRVRVHAAPGFTLAIEADGEPRSTPLGRFLRVHPAPTPSALLSALAPLGPRLAAVGVAGLGGAQAELAEAFAALGASRVCPLGALQAPPLDWCHDQGGVLLPLARLSDLAEVGTR